MSNEISQPLVVSLPLPEDTDRLGRAFARTLCARADEIRRTGLAIRLEGDLGAGKTSLVRAILRGLGYEGAVKSPTFSLLETYAVAGLEFNHFDFYRFETPEEFEDAGFEECFHLGAVCATEWSEKAVPYLPPADLIVNLTVEGLGRRAELTPQTEAARVLLASLPKDLE